MPILGELHLFDYLFPLCAIVVGAIWRVWDGLDSTHMLACNRGGVRIAVGSVGTLGIAYLSLGAVPAAAVVAVGAMASLAMAMGEWHRWISVKQSWPVAVAVMILLLPHAPYLGWLGSYLGWYDPYLGCLYVAACFAARAYYPIMSKINPNWHWTRGGEALLGGTHIGLIAVL